MEAAMPFCLVQNFFAIDNSNLFVGNGNITQEVAVMLRINLCDTKVTGDQQETVNTVGIILNFRIDYVGVYVSCDTLSP